MKKILSFGLSILIITAMLFGCSRVVEFTFCPEIEGGDVAVVSFNCAAPWGNVLKGTGSSARVKRFAVYMNAVKADSIGTQEMNSQWMEKLTELMPDYDSYGVKRGGDENEKKSEMNTIFWLKDKYSCVDKGTFWLSETPEAESRYEGAGCNRVCTYVVLENRETGKQYIHMNTHLDNASDDARAFGAQVIVQKISELRQKYADTPIVLSGDFNDTLDGDACSVISKVLTAQSVGTNTYHDWGNITEGEPIDYIFTDGKIVGATPLGDTTNGLVSDHYGVYETINFE